MRTTPNKITKLEPNQIFVFGSNQSGIHGKVQQRQHLGGVQNMDKRKDYKGKLMEYQLRINL